VAHTTGPNQDLGPTARRYDIDVVEPPRYIANNPESNMHGTLLDAGKRVKEFKK
jgi:hypothetical protein